MVYKQYFNYYINNWYSSCSVYIYERRTVMPQDELKNRLVALLKNEGINQKFISKKTKISESVLSRFKNDKTELDMIDYQALSDYLLSKGY